MYWMLLPPSANVGRQIDNHSLPQIGSWGTLMQAGWGLVRHFLATIHR
jgi:hypothetical protein